MPFRIGTSAKALAAKGVKSGDVVSIHMPNSPEYVIAFQAVCSLGAICTTSNPLYTPAELAHQLRDSGAKFAITVPQLLDSMRKVPLQWVSTIEFFVIFRTFAIVRAGGCGFGSQGHLGVGGRQVGSETETATSGESFFCAVP